MTILIVEDNPEMRRLLRGLLEDVVEAIFECEDGAEALATYEAHRPDWVLMDIKMQDIDGIEATRQLTQTWPAARVAMVTDYDDTQLREAAQLAGAKAYVLKENLLEIRKILLGAARPVSNNVTKRSVC